MVPRIVWVLLCSCPGVSGQQRVDKAYLERVFDDAPYLGSFRDVFPLRGLQP